MTKDEILLFLHTNKPLFAQQYGIISIGLFGSHARGEAREDSDLDIAIEMEPRKKTLRNFFELKRLLESQFGPRHRKHFETACARTSAERNSVCLKGIIYSIFMICRTLHALKAKNTDIPWQDIKDFRNLLAHEYFGVDLEIVWNTVHGELPKLLEVVNKLLLSVQNQSHTD